MTEQSSESHEIAKPSIVTLIIPCKPEYVSVARLAMLGVASRLPWSAEEVEDIRLAVGEVCTDAVERAAEHDPATVAGLSIEIIAVISGNKLTVDIRDHVPPAPSDLDKQEMGGDDLSFFSDRQGISDALIEALVDTFARSQEMGGTTVRLTKHLATHEQP